MSTEAASRGGDVPAAVDAALRRQLAAAEHAGDRPLRQVHDRIRAVVPAEDTNRLRGCSVRSGKFREAPGIPGKLRAAGKSGKTRGSTAGAGRRGVEPAREALVVACGRLVRSAGGADRAGQFPESPQFFGAGGQAPARRRVLTDVDRK